MDIERIAAYRHQSQNMDGSNGADDQRLTPPRRGELEPLSRHKKKNTMQKLIAELEAKAYYSKSLDCKFFFAWNIFAQAKHMGLAIDGNALSDPMRSAPEVAKLLHVCAQLYVRTAEKLTATDAAATKVPEVREIEAWLLIAPAEAAEAMRFLHDQMTEGDVGGEVVKKNQPSENLTGPTESSKSPIPSKPTRTRWWHFWRGSAKRGISSES